MVKQWHGTLARYNRTKNMVAERRVRDFATAKEAETWINKYHNKPVYVWHDDAVMLDNPYFSMIETNAYKAEIRKVID